MTRVDDRSRLLDTKVQHRPEAKEAERAADDGVPELSELTSTLGKEGPAAQLERGGSVPLSSTFYDKSAHKPPPGSELGFTPTPDVLQAERQQKADELRMQANDLAVRALETQGVSAAAAEAMTLAAEELEGAAAALAEGKAVDTELVKERVGTFLDEAAGHLAGAQAEAREQALSAVPEDKRSALKEALDKAERVVDIVDMLSPPGTPFDVTASTLGAAVDLLQRYEKAGSVGGALQTYVDDAKSTLDDVKRFVSDFRLPSSQMEALQPGDSASYGLGAEAEWTGLKVAGEAKVTLSSDKKPDGTVDYVVQDERTFALGAGVGSVSGAELSATRGVTLRFEMRTGDREAAKDLADDAGLRLGAATVPGLNVAVEALTAPDALKHCKALELSAADAVKLGIPLPEGVGASAAVGLQEDTTVRFEIKDGKLDKMRLKRAYKLEGAVELGFRSEGAGAGFSVTGPKKGGSASLAIEQEYDVKGSFGAADLLRAHAAMNGIFIPSTDKKTKITLELDAQNVLKGAKAKVEAEIGNDAKGQSLLKAALDDVASGELQKGLGRFSSLEATATVTPYARTEAKVSVSAGKEGAKGGGSVELKRETVGKPLLEHKGKPLDCLERAVSTLAAAVRREDDAALEQMKRNQLVR